MKPTTETTKTQTVPGEGIDADVLLAFLAGVPGSAPVRIQTHYAAITGQCSTTITARWTPEGEDR